MKLLNASIFFKNKKNIRLFIFGGYIMLLFLISIIAPVLVNHDPYEMNPSERFREPGGEYFFGTDEFGRDIYSRIIVGSRMTLIISITSASIAMILGVIFGLIAAYLGNPLDTIIMRIADIMLCFPTMLLCIFVIAFAGSSLINVIITISIVYMPRFTRLAYSSTLSTQGKEYIKASIVLGASNFRTMFRHILPNIFSSIIVLFSLAIGHIIIIESSLSYLGLGPPIDIPAWGRMIQQSSRFMNLSYYGVIFPAVAISTTILAFNLFGDALRDYYDPRLSIE